MRFTISRKIWLRGEGKDASFLLRADGKRCCVGQPCSQLGIPDSALAGVCEATAIEGMTVDALNLLVPWAWLAYPINDDPELEDAEREKKLSALVESRGHEFVFVD